MQADFNPNIVTVYMIRHGEAEDTGGITGGGLNARLSPEGQKQAVAIRLIMQTLGIEVVYHSGMHRTKETVDLAFKDMNVTVYSDRDFREIEHGVMEGTPGDVRKEIWKSFIENESAKWEKEYPGEELPADFKYSRHPHPEKPGQYLFPVDPKYYIEGEANGAETFYELMARASSATLNAAKAHHNKVIAVVAHNAAMQSLIAQSKMRNGTLGKGEDKLYPMFFEKSLIDNCGIAEFKVNLSTNEIDFVRFVESTTS